MARNRASPGQQLPGVERAVRTLTCAATARSAGSRASARARTDRRACTTVRGRTDGNRMARAFPPDLARVGELRRPEVPVRDARAVCFGGLAMNDAERLAEIRKSIEDGETIETEETVWEFCEIAERALSELAEAKRLSEQYLAASADNLVCFHRAENERDAALAEVERWKDDYDEEARACEENARETQEARAEAEARDQHHKDYHAYCGALSVRQFIEARLSPPAPAPKCAKHDAHHFGSDDGGKTVERYGAIPGTNGREPCQDGSAFAKPAPGGR